MVAVACEQVWQEISNYIEDEISPALRSALEIHFGECQRCASVLEGTRNVVQLYGDERLFQMPLGYSWRLKRRLHNDMRVRRRTVLAWLAASAAAAVISGSVVWKSRHEDEQALRSPHSDPGRNVPGDLAVVVNVHGK